MEIPENTPAVSDSKLRNSLLLETFVNKLLDEPPKVILGLFFGKLLIVLVTIGEGPPLGILD